MARPLAILSRDKDGCDTVADFLAGFQEGDLIAGACGTLHLQVITIVIVVPLQRLNDEIVDYVCVPAGGRRRGRRGRRRRRREQEHKTFHPLKVYFTQVA